MKKRKRSRFKPTRKTAKPRAVQGRTVERMAAAGLSGDYIAQTLGVGQNQLRREHALDLHAGRKIKAAERAAADAVSKEKRALIEQIERAFASDWYSPEHGCDLYGGAKSIEEAIAWCEQFKRN